MGAWSADLRSSVSDHHELKQAFRRNTSDTLLHTRINTYTRV
jgi:hypothetical protein